MEQASANRPDHTAGDTPINPTMQQLKQRSKWIRILYMLLLLFAYGVVEFILTGIVIVQVVLNLLTGKINKNLLNFSDDLAAYVYDLLRFLTYNSDDKPFPFSEWKSAATRQVTPTDPHE